MISNGPISQLQVPTGKLENSSYNVLYTLLLLSVNIAL